MASAKKNVAFVVIISLLQLVVGASADKKIPSTREMNLLCWQEFQELVPAQIETVLLPVGSLEPHGVIPSGTDNLAPTQMASEIAGQLNALIAPTLNYGVTAAMAGYPGAVTISPESFGPFIRDILRGLAQTRFKNIIILNGHGGNTELLQSRAAEMANECRVRILVLNWWALTPDITREVFHQDGGHAGNNETAYIQAFLPQHIHPERFNRGMATANATDGAWYAVPVPSSILLYKEGEGFPTFDPKQARDYFSKVNKRVTAVIRDIISKWDQAAIFK